MQDLLPLAKDFSFLFFLAFLALLGIAIAEELFHD